MYLISILSRLSTYFANGRPIKYIHKTYVGPVEKIPVSLARLICYIYLCLMLGGRWSAQIQMRCVVSCAEVVKHVLGTFIDTGRCVRISLSSRFARNEDAYSVSVVCMPDFNVSTET